MFLYDDNLIIRNATAEDAKLLCEWWNDGRIMAHAGYPKGLGISQQDIIDKISNDSDDTRRRLIIEIDSEPIGEMSYNTIESTIAEIGIKICNFEKQDKGLGTRYLKMLIFELFRMGYSKIMLDTNINNERAQHVYKKLGFRKVGVRVDTWIDQFGIPQTAVDFEMTQSDFIM